MCTRNIKERQSGGEGEVEEEETAEGGGEKEEKGAARVVDEGVVT